MRFERGREIKRSLEIGIFSPREFQDDYEAMEFIFENLEAIFGKPNGYTLLTKIEEYVLNYVHIYNNGYDGPNWKEIGMADPSLMGLIVPRLEKEKDEIRKRIRP